MYGDIFGWGNEVGSGTNGIYLVKARDAVKYSTKHRNTPDNKKIIWSQMSIKLRLKNPAINEQREELSHIVKQKKIKISVVPFFVKKKSECMYSVYTCKNVNNGWLGMLKSWKNFISFSFYFAYLKFLIFFYH